MLSPTQYVVNSALGSVSGSGTTGTLPYVVGQINGTSNVDGYDVTFMTPFFSSSRTIPLAAPLDLTQTVGPITITGTSNANVKISGAMNDVDFDVSAGVNATLADLTITHAMNTIGGGVSLGVATLTLTGDIISNNKVTASGGGILDYGGKVSISGTCSITNNSAGSSGGGIYESDGGTVTVSDSTVSHNTADYGGGIYVGGGTLTVTGSAVSHNTADYGGGGIYDSGGNVLVTSGASLTHNAADTNGGAIYEKSGAVTITDSTVSHNTAVDGGGIYVATGTLTITGVTLALNTASAQGGAIYNSAGTVKISSTCNITSNSAGTSGGGIYDGDGSVTISGGSTVSDNKAEYGGGVYVNTGTLTVTNSGLVHNTTDYGGQGGGIFDYGGNVKISGGAGLTSNAANLSGGAIYESGAAKVTITGSTLLANTAEYGGGIYVNGGSLTITGGTTALNTATSQGGAIFNMGGTVDISGIAYVTSNSTTGGLGSGGAIFEEGGTVTISSSVLAKNSAKYGGGIFLYGGALNLIDATLTVNIAKDGGGIYARGVSPGAVLHPDQAGTAAHVDITDSCALTSNTASSQGGGIDVRTGATVEVTASNVARNTAGAVGGGVYVDGGTITIEFSTILNNRADYGGGGIFDYGGKVVVSDSCSMSSNSAVDYGGSGGAILAVGGATVSISNSTFAFNSADYGGGVAVLASALTIERSYFTGNHATVGGALFAEYGGGMSIKSGCSFSGNTAGSYGGGLFAAFGETLSITGSTVANNSAGEYGGGIAVFGVSLTIAASTLSGNSTDGFGGGLAMVESEGTITNATIADNSADYGGGIVSAGYLNLVNVTIADNKVTGGGGGLAIESGDVELFNTIVAQNTGTNNVPDDILGPVTGSYNLIGTGGSGGLVNGVAGNQVGVANPVLGVLALNGGPTQTIAVLPGSPAIGSGSSNITDVDVPTVDQRGVARPPDSIDVGAFQDRGFVMTVVPGSTPQYTPVNKAFTVPLSVLVTSPYGDPVAGGIVIFTPPGSGASAALTPLEAKIGASGVASTIAVANGIGGTYQVSAAARGVTPGTVYFTLTNTTQNAVAALSIGWGIRTVALQVVPSSGGVMFSSGRHTDLPWEGINQFLITFNQSEQFRSSGVTITSALGIPYGPVIVSGANKSFQIILGRAINQADRVTISITSNAGNLIFSGSIYVLPGDFNDDGVVTMADANAIRDEWLSLDGAKPTIFGDINGDGYVNGADYYLTLAALGTTLPPIQPAIVLGASGGRGSGAVKIGASPPGTGSPAVVRGAGATTRGPSLPNLATTRPARSIVADRLRPRAELELAARGRKPASRRH